MLARPEFGAPATAPHARPRSEAQRAAARANGARSRGPVTAEGKARASKNAFRHGLWSESILAPGEDPAAFAALLAELRAEHAPRTTSDALLVERLAVAFWKLARCDRLEARLATIEPRCPEGRLFPEPGLPRLLSRVPELGVVLRHQAQLQREVHRLLRTLAERAAIEPAEPAEPETADPVPAELAAEPDEENLRNEPEPADPAADPEPAPAASGADPVRSGEPARPVERASTADPVGTPRPEPRPHAPVDAARARVIEDQLFANGDRRGLERLARARSVRNMDASPPKRSSR
jgi:hypothetical protein